MTKLTENPNTPVDLLTRLTELEVQLASLRAELDRSQKLAMLGTVAAMVAHEVNNLMTPIATYAQMAQASPGDVALVAKALDRARQGAHQASRIATSILALAKPDGITEHPECDVAAAIADAVACVPRGTLRAIQIESQPQPDLRAGISQAALQQIVLNLVLNAVKAIGKSSGGISIRSRLDGTGAVVVEVEDDGPGVPVTLASRVFEPFAACASGTGLGLAICNRLVHEVGGSIWIDNPGGVGARFCVRLPKATATKAA
jgi:two-component system, NtrC family, sensor kinase